MEIREQFKAHELNERGQAKVEQVREEYTVFLTKLELLMGDSSTNARECAIVRSKLEEASMYTIKAIARHPANQK